MSELWRLQMGAMPEVNGCRFRVWAPNAREVYVVGSFNDGSKTRDALVAEGDSGCWSGFLQDVKPGDEYRYRIVTDAQEFMRMDPYSRAVSHSAGQSIVPDIDFDWGPLPFEAPHLNAMVIYEMHLGTFAKVPGNGPGTIEDAIAKLDYLRELGVNALELMPIMEFPGGYSWGYNPALIFAIESDYGSARDLRRFVRSAHERGMAVILDVVYNHLGPDDLDLWQFDGWHENGKGGIYFYNDERAGTPWGDTRPDYGRREVREFIRDNALYWLSQYHFDGLRWDATAFVRSVGGHGGDGDQELADGWGLMQWIDAEARRVKPEAFLIAEDLRDDPALTRSPEDGGAGFDAQWDARFVHPVRQALIGADDAGRDMDAVRDAILHRYDTDAFNRVIYTESHDEVANGKARVPEEVDPGHAASWAAKKKSALGAALVFSSPGIPMVFQGQEFLEDDWFHDKNPLDWSKRERFAGIWLLYRDLIALRLNREGRTAGLCGQHADVFLVDRERKALAYHRWADGGPSDSVVVAANFSTQCYEDYEMPFPAVGRWSVRFNSDSRVYDADFGDKDVPAVDCAPPAEEGGPAVGRTVLPPYTAVIFSQDR